MRAIGIDSKNVIITVFVCDNAEMMVETEGRHCESKSHRFKGMCVSHQNCASVCHVEGFTGGHCRGFRRRCFCTRHC